MTRSPSRARLLALDERGRRLVVEEFADPADVFPAIWRVSSDVLKTVRLLGLRDWRIGLHARRGMARRAPRAPNRLRRAGLTERRSKDRGEPAVDARMEATHHAGRPRSRATDRARVGMSTHMPRRAVSLAALVATVSVLAVLATPPPSARAAAVFSVPGAPGAGPARYDRVLVERLVRRPRAPCSCSCPAARAGPAPSHSWPAISSDASADSRCGRSSGASTPSRTHR